MSYPPSPNQPPTNHHYPQESVTSYRKQTRHGLHLILTIFTCGAWSIVWACVAMWNAWGPRGKIRTRNR